MDMKFYAERPGGVQVGATEFDAARGMRVTLRESEGELLVDVPGLSEPLIVCEGLPLSLVIYGLPE